MPEPILQEPAAIFMTLMAVILIAPLLTERVNLPGIVGLILGGMLLGRHGLNLFAVGNVIVTTMASHGRFATGEERIPEELSRRFSGSISILHYP